MSALDPVTEPVTNPNDNGLPRTPWTPPRRIPKPPSNVADRALRSAAIATAVVLVVVLVVGVARPLAWALVGQLGLTLAARHAARRGWVRAAALVASAGLIALPWWPGVTGEITALGLATLLGPVSAVVVAALTLPAEGTVGVAVVALVSAMLLGLRAPVPPSVSLAFSAGAAGLGVIILGVHGAVTWEINRLRRHATKQNSLLDELQLAAEGAHVGLWHWDLRTKVVHLSARAEEILGLPRRGAHADDAWLARVEPSDVGRLRADLHALSDRPIPTLETRFRVGARDVDERWVLLRAAASREGGRAVRLAGSITDVTSWTRNEARLRENAFHDPLTRLPNRALMLDQLGHLFARSRQDPAALFAVLFIDLDGFKLINDSLGHKVGDGLLVEIARRLERAVRPSDMVARLGGDEFVLLLDNLATPDEAIQVASRVLARLRPVAMVQGHELATGASIGVAMGPGTYDEPEEILRDADTAMYRAKADGKGRCRMFDAQMRQMVVARMTLERELQVAVENREFQLVYQPIVQLETKAIHGFEALIRWPRGARPPVGPAEFIPVAEENGLILPISWWVLETAVATVARWRETIPGAEGVWVQVNICADCLTQPNLLPTVLDLLARHRLTPDALRFEITETAVIEPGGRVREMLEALRTAGIKIHLDDFGTGYSSLSYLYRYPVDGLKIDRSFVSGLDSGSAPGLVEPILQIARSLNLSVTAEGIETAAQYERLVALGCVKGQGYFFSPGVSEIEAGRMLERGPGW